MTLRRCLTRGMQTPPEGQVAYCPGPSKPMGCLYLIEGFARPLFHLLGAEQLQPASRRWAVWRAPVRSNLAPAGHNDPNDLEAIRPFISISTALPLLSLLSSSHSWPPTIVLPPPMFFLLPVLFQ